MKKPNTIKLLFFVALTASVLFSCSKDDDGGNDPFADVPKGEIVPVEERNQTLTGFSEQRNNDEQVWWKHVISTVDIDCGEDSDYWEEIFEDSYVAFKPDGQIYSRNGVDGEEYASGTTWEWENEDKDAVIIDLWGDGTQSAVFELRELNDGGVVYASLQSEGSNCTAVTWDQFKK